MVSWPTYPNGEGSGKGVGRCGGTSRLDGHLPALATTSEGLVGNISDLGRQTATGGVGRGFGSAKS